MKKFFKSIVIIMFFLIITSSSYVGRFDGGIDNETYLSFSKIDSRKIKNIAVFIEFIDSDALVQNHLDDPISVENAYKVYNSEELFEMNTPEGIALVPSFKKFFKNESYGSLIIDTDIYPKVSDKVVSYTDGHPLGYYLKKTIQNDVGYSNYDEKVNRENELIENALSYIKTQVENTYSNGSILDTDNNGFIDAISFIVETPSGAGIQQGDLLWSHKNTTTSVSSTLFDKKVSSYNLIKAEDYKSYGGLFSLNRGSYGTLMHEFGHTLDFSDLYSSYANQSASVGFYDLMGNYSASNPSGFLTYFISDYRTYNNWHNPLEVISSSMENITLTKPNYIDPNEKRAVKIQAGNKNEYFIIEYYAKKKTYSSHTPDKSGIIVYRINELYNGSDTSKFVYIFRPEENVLGEGKGDLTKATLNMDRKVFGSAIDGTTTFDNSTIHYSDGSNSGVIITVKSETENSVTFDVTFPDIIGSGTEENPYLINSVDDFLYFMESALVTSNHHFKLMSDLDFSNVQNYPKVNFSGILDGNNKVLKNITAKGVGLFDSVGYNKEQTIVKNIILENINITPGSGGYLGGFANSVDNASISNITIINGSILNKKGVYLQATGGLIGTGNNSVILSNCSVQANIASDDSVGGLIGLNQNISMNNLSFTGNVNGEKNAGMVIGLQLITDSPYKVPVDVFYEYLDTKNTPAVGGVYSGHDANLLPLDQLEKGIIEKKSIPIENIKVDKTTVNIWVGERVSINTTIEPINHTMSKTLLWTSSNEQVVAVDSNGNITAKSVGEAIITVSTVNNKVAKVVVTVKDNKVVLEEDVLNYLGLVKKDSYVYGFAVGTKLKNIKEKINNYQGLKLQYFNPSSGSFDLIATGVKFGLLINGTEYDYTVIVKGDVDGDGKIFATDYVKVRNHIMGKTSLSEVSLKTADINGDGKIFATDYVKIRNHIMGIGNISQK